MTPADAGEGCSGDGGPVPAVMIEPAPLPNVRGFEAPSLRATFRFRNNAIAPLSTQSKVLRPIISMKAMKVSASGMKPAMKAMKSMKSMKSMKYEPGTLVPLQESRDAPGSRPTIYPPAGVPLHQKHDAERPTNELPVENTVGLKECGARNEGKKKST